MAHPYSPLKRSTVRKQRRPRRASLEDTLLNPEERAVLYELDRDLLKDSEDHDARMNTRFMSCLRSTKSLCCDKGNISLILTLVLAVLGASLLALSRGLDLPLWVHSVSNYVLSAGVFGLAGGGTNWLAIVMLFYRIPLLYGSGVFYRQHKQIRDVIKLIVLQMLFDSEHIENYITKRIRQFSSNVHIVDNITQALNSEETDRIIDKSLDRLFSQPESYYLDVLGLSREQIRPMIKPSVISLCAESAPFVLGTVTESDKEQAISVPRFREEMDRYLSWRVEELTGRRVGRLMRTLMYQHLGWVVVWGSIFGIISGVIIQGAKISLNFNFLVRQ